MPRAIAAFFCYDNNMKKYFYLILIFAFLELPFLCSASTPLSGVTPSGEKIFYMSNLKEKEGIISLQNNAYKIDIIAPQFYAVSAKLKLTGGLDANLKKTIQQAQGKNNKLKVMPLVANAGFKQSVIHNLLVSPKAQTAVIQSMIDVAKKEKYIGWQFDFENISYKDKDLYSAFVEKTAKSMKKNGLTFSVAVVTRSVDYENTDAFKNWGGVFDYARIAKAVDFVSFMTYDDPNSVGPVASIPFINSVLAYVKGKIPPEKLSLGIPVYYWGWTKEPLKKVNASGSYSRLLALMANNQYTSGFDSALSAPWISYSYGNNQFQIWYQNQQSFNDRLDIIKQNNFRGFSAWVLGVEDPGIWDLLK